MEDDSIKSEEELLDTQTVIENSNLIEDTSNNTIVKLDKLLSDEKVINNTTEDFSFFEDAADF